MDKKPKVGSNQLNLLTEGIHRGNATVGADRGHTAVERSVVEADEAEATREGAVAAEVGKRPFFSAPLS